MSKGLPVSVEHHDPVVKRVVEEIITEHLEEYQAVMLRMMKAWTLNDTSSLVGKSFLSTMARPGTYTNASIENERLFMRLFGAEAVYPEIDRILRNPKKPPPDYPPLVVDREKVRRQIDWCLDPNKAMSEWFDSEVGRRTGLFYPGYGTARALKQQMDRMLTSNPLADLLGL